MEPLVYVISLTIINMFKHCCFLIFLFFGGYSLQAGDLRIATPECDAAIEIKIPQPTPEVSYSDGAQEVIQLILETIGLQATFEVRKANVQNAAAVVYQGKRYILYNPSFIAAMNKAAGTPWAAIAVMAHEIGHHLNGHTLDGKGSLPEIELEADEFSGFVLRKMGASLSEAQLAMRIIAHARATKTHPARNERLMAIAEGWNRADEQIAGGHGVRKQTPPGQEAPAEASVLADEYIAYDVHFSFDPRAEYHVTVRNNLVKLFNNKLEVLGKLRETGKQAFPLAFQTGAADFLLISRNGEIFTPKGTSLGYITPRK